MLKVVGIVGSPRKDGNTEYMVRKCLEYISQEDIEVELVTLHDKNISFCVGCDSCKATNKCVINDDMQMLTDKVRDADGVIMSSPVYFGDMTGLAKTFIDRLRPLRNVHAFKYKVCGAVSTGGFRNGGQESTIASIHDFFLIQGGIVVGDSFMRSVLELLKTLIHLFLPRIVSLMVYSISFLLMLNVLELLYHGHNKKFLNKVKINLFKL